MKIYENDEIYVRPLLESDTEKESYKQWFYDQEVCKYNSHGIFSHGFMAKDIIKLDSDKNIVWAVIKKNYEEEPYNNQLFTILNEKHIGNIVLQDINWINRNAEFTCIFGEKEYWGEGYCSIVLEWIMDHGFHKLNLHKIWLGTSNPGMEKAALNAGMEQEAELWEDVFIEGEFKNTIRYAVRIK